MDQTDSGRRKIKVYTAASFSDQKRIREQKEKLIQQGHNVLASWLEEQIKPEGMTENQFHLKMAAKDLREIQASDCIILDMFNRTPSMGKMVEYGFALAHHKLLYVVGAVPKYSIFLLLADGVFKDWPKLLKHLEENHAVHKAGTA